MVEILDHAPSDWTSSERLVALAIAEHANDKTRRGYPGMELLTHRLGVDDKSVSRLLRQLSRKGYELRVPVGEDRKGQAVFATRSHRSVYRLPQLCPNEVHNTNTCLKRVAVSPPFDASDCPDGGGERVAVSPPIPEQRVTEPPPFNEERVASGSSKGGHMATPSPQYPSKNNPSSGAIENSPHTGRSDWRKIDEAKEEIEKIPEPLRTIVVSLADTNPDATRAEAAAVHQLIAKQAAEIGNPIKSVKYYTRIAETGGFGMALTNVRAQRAVSDDRAVADAAAAVKAEIIRLQESEPECGHGTPAGGSPHPKTGEPLCPLCRVGVAAPETVGEVERPDSARVADAYRLAWTEAGHGPIEITTIRTIERQARASLDNGFDLDFLIHIAQAAAPQREDLFRTASQLAMETAQ